MPPQETSTRRRMVRLKVITTICKFGGIGVLFSTVFSVATSTATVLTWGMLFGSVVLVAVGFVGVRTWKLYANARRDLIHSKVEGRGQGPNGEFYVTEDEFVELQELAAWRFKRKGDIYEAP